MITNKVPVRAGNYGKSIYGEAYVINCEPFDVGGLLFRKLHLFAIRYETLQVAL